MKSLTPTPPSDLRTHLGFWLRTVSNHVSQSFAQKLLATGVTVAEWVILREMFDRPNTAPSDLADITGLTRGAISKLAERLIVKKLLSRTYAEDDRRYQILVLTASGKELVPKLAAIADQNDEEFFAMLTEKQRSRFFKILKKLAATHQLHNIPIE